MNQTFNRRNPKITNRRNTKRKNRRNTKRKNRRNTNRKNRRNTKRTNIKNRKGGGVRGLLGKEMFKRRRNEVENGQNNPLHKRQESFYSRVSDTQPQAQKDLIDFFKPFIDEQNLQRGYFKKRMLGYSVEDQDNLFDKFQPTSGEVLSSGEVLYSELLFFLFNVFPSYYGFLNIDEITGKNQEYEDKITDKFEYKPENGTGSMTLNPMTVNVPVQNGPVPMSVNGSNFVSPLMYLYFDYYDILWNIILNNWKLYYLFLDLYMYQNLLEIIKQIKNKSPQINLKVLLFACSENIPINLDVPIDYKESDALHDIINIELEEIQESKDFIFEELIDFYLQLYGKNDEAISQGITQGITQLNNDIIQRIVASNVYEYIFLMFSTDPESGITLGPFIYEKYCGILEEILK